MDISIQPVEEVDLPTIGKLLTEYKMSLSINRLLWKVWPNSTLQHEQTLASIKISFDGQSSQLFKAVDKNGELSGFICITRHRPAPVPSSADSKPSTGPTEVPERFNPDVFTTVVTAMGDIGRETEDVDHLNISAFAVQSDRYGNGVGSKLMGVAFDRAKAEKLPVVIRAEPGSYRFFKKHGFKETKVVEFDLAKWAEPFSGYGLFKLTGMIWHP